MDVSHSTTIERPREEVFEYLADIANLPEYTDHFLGGFHLTREESYGRGAGVRFKVRQRFNRFSDGDFTYAEVDSPRRIVARGRSGKYNRVRWLAVWELEATGPRTTRVDFSLSTQPPLLSDRLAEAMGAAARHRRGWRRALKRLRAILEDGRERGQRATIAGGPRKPATGTPIRHARL
jgi:uncharacterized protein YndB with AHSA1/START domain